MTPTLSDDFGVPGGACTALEKSASDGARNDSTLSTDNVPQWKGRSRRTYFEHAVAVHEQVVRAQVAVADVLLLEIR